MRLRKMKRNNSELADSIQDAHLFVRLHISTAGPKTLQALNTTIFCPEEGLWASTVNPWLRKHPKIDKTWSPNYTTFRGHISEVRSISISSDGRVLASGSDDGTVRIWDTETGTAQHAFEARDGTYSYVTQVALASRIIAAALDDLPVILWDTLTGRKVGELPAYTTAADALCLSPDGRKIAVASRMKVYVSSIEGVFGEFEPKDPVQFPIGARGLVFSRDNELLVTSKDAIQLYDTCAALSPCKISGTRLLASGSEDGNICIWEMDADIKYGANAPTPAIKPLHIRKLGGSKDEDTPSPARRPRSNRDPSINSLAFSPDGSCLASSSYNVINIWETTTMRHLDTLPARGLASHVLVFDSIGGDYLISSATDKAVHFWYANGKHGEASPSKGLVNRYKIGSASTNH
ncbi:hypothetical protein NPX13_g7105 [Xylaria arbuscula]|uniref:Anaphase-promoting complex subunit 4 WD40 domain-containing protein n=1 Tax=Xylaria arbuscula TaxID=114810 RepID=A0A9W8NB70_9PEZI|nr:hypothetical protein NPX13_g7105 [Xylaria arbuscula]